MKRDIVLTKPITSSFLSCEKDTKEILERLFVKSRPYSDLIKKLLIINISDCLDESSKNAEKYKEIIDSKKLKDLIDEGYIRMSPKLRFGEYEEVKSYIIITFDNFKTTDTNPQFRDCSVSFDIICHTDSWQLKDYAIRPLKIAGYIDGLLNNSKLTGIGTFNFLGCNELILDENLSGYTLVYQAVHGSDDQIEAVKE